VIKIFIFCVFYAQVAGKFYPANRDELLKMIKILGEGIKKEVKGEIFGLICPHAGYIFSGRTASFAFKQLEGLENKTFIIIGLKHGFSTYPIAVMKSEKFITPLGEAHIDKNLSQKIANFSDKIFYTDEPFYYEHSAEVEIPFIQYYTKNPKFVLILMREQSFDLCKKLADAISNAIKGRDDVIIVASSDFYHGYDYNMCKEITKEAADAILSLEPSSFYELFVKKHCACAGGAITTLLLLAKKEGADKIKLMHITNSGDVTGRKEGYVVGYASFVITK